MVTAADSDRDIEMLAELAELGLELAREVAAHAKSRLIEARESGWDGGLPADPGAPFARLAQSVRRSIALKAKLAEDAGAANPVPSAGGARPFASSGPPLTLSLDFAAAVAPPPLAADRLVREARRESDGRETIASDLGSLLEPREHLFEVPLGAFGPHAAALCESLGLDPARLTRRPQGWFICPDPAGAGGANEIRLRHWRPDLGAVLKAHGWPLGGDHPRAAKLE